MIAVFAAAFGIALLALLALGVMQGRAPTLAGPVVKWRHDGVRYKCGSCRKWHDGLPRWMFAAPDDVLEIPERERAARAVREEDGYLLDGRWFFALAILDVPVHGVAEPYGWGVWVNLRREDAVRFLTLYNDANRGGGESFEGRLANSLPGYPATRNLSVRLRLRPWPERAQVEVLGDEHPLARQQRDGITREQVRSLLTGVMPPRHTAPPHPTRATASAVRS